MCLSTFCFDLGLVRSFCYEISQKAGNMKVRLNMFYYLSILIIVVSNIFYHFASKMVPEKSNPFFFVMVSYIIGFIFALVAFFFTKGDKGFMDSITEQTKIINWTPILLGVSVIGLEIGNVLMYRAGWDISRGSLYSNILLALVLVIVGVVFYRDNFTLKNVLGLFSCVLGLYLLS
jgi:drug/metabolite transporter (DMT)-like permease